MTSLDGESGQHPRTVSPSSPQCSLALVSLQIARVVGRGTPPGEGRRGGLPLWSRLVQGCHTLGTPEFGVAEAPAETMGSVTFV